MRKVIVITHFPSPYQVELFDILAARRKIDLEVVYLNTNSSNRRWLPSARLHSGVCIDQSENEAVVETWTKDSDVVVFNYYRHAKVRGWMLQRAHSGSPWVFWGERLGFRSPHFVGRIYRRWALRCLAKSHAPIWGIGSWAVESYQREFGLNRDYINLPYFSDLSRFTAAGSTRTRDSSSIRFLYSGSLIERKGVDLLAVAFKKLALSNSRVRLCFLGEGPMLDSLKAILAPVADFVQFLGFKDWQALPSVYAQADILCAPSIHDGWGLIIPEGLASGMPTISTSDTGAAREFIRTRKNGWIIPAGDPEALFQVMQEASLLNADQLECMSREAIKSVANHTLDEGAARFETACHAAVSKWK